MSSMSLTSRSQSGPRRFALFGVRSLGDAPRPGVPRTHGDDKIAEIVKLRNHDQSTGFINPPANQHHGNRRWSLSFYGGEDMANFRLKAP